MGTAERRKREAAHRRAAILAAAKKLIGDRVCLKGYTDLIYVIKMGTPETIREAVREIIRVGAPGGGFILGSSDSFRDSSFENVKAFFDAAREFGSY